MTGKRVNEKSAETVPTKVAKTTPQAAGAASGLPSWDWPEPNGHDDVTETMARVVPWVQAHLPVFLDKHKNETDFKLVGSGAISNYKPLDVNATEAQSSSYKEAWDDQRAVTSLAQNSMYEAGGNACWASLGKESMKLFHDKISWEKLVELVEKHWSQTAMTLGRFVWPGFLHVYVTKEQATRWLF